MFETIVRMKMANPSPNDGTITDHKEAIFREINAMNAQNSNYNKKRVTLLEPDDDTSVLLKVETELELTVPGRAFTGLSRALSEGRKDCDENLRADYAYFAKNVFHKRLFVFEVVHDEPELEKITDTELILRTVLLATKAGSLRTQADRDILRKMKALVANVKSSND